MNVRFAKLLPFFEAEGLQVFNCTPGSGLEVFPYVPFDDAIASAEAAVPDKIVTAGMYDKQAQQKKQNGRHRKKEASPPPRKSSQGRLAIKLSPERNGANHRRRDDVTLVTIVRSEQEAAFPYAWENWTAFCPEVPGGPVVIGGTSPQRVRERLAAGGPPPDQLAVVAMETGQDDEAFLRDIIRSHVRTSWVIYVSPYALWSTHKATLLPESIAADLAYIGPKRNTSRHDRASVKASTRLASPPERNPLDWLLIAQTEFLREWAASGQRLGPFVEATSRPCWLTRLESLGWEEARSLRMLRRRQEELAKNSR